MAKFKTTTVIDRPIYRAKIVFQCKCGERFSTWVPANQLTIYEGRIIGATNRYHDNCIHGFKNYDDSRFVGIAWENGKPMIDRERIRFEFQAKPPYYVRECQYQDCVSGKWVWETENVPGKPKFVELKRLVA